MVAPAVLASLVLCAPLGVTNVAYAASAAGTRSQIAQVEAEMAATTASVHELALRYDQATLQAATYEEQAAADAKQIASLQATVVSEGAALRKAAILSYTGAEAGVDLPKKANPAIGAEYLQVAVGDVTQSVEQLRLSQRQLASEERALHADQRSAAEAAASAASAEREALAQASSEQQQLGRLQAQLDALLAAQAAAAQARAAAAAQARAAAAAQARAAAAAQATQAQSKQPPAPQGTPVDNGLVSVVKALVSPSPPPASPGGGAGGVWLQLRECESGDNYQANTGNGYYGAYQFSQQTWTSLGYPGRPDLEPPAMQDQAAMRLQQEYGWGQWPACAAALGLT